MSTPRRPRQSQDGTQPRAGRPSRRHLSTTGGRLASVTPRNSTGIGEERQPSKATPHASVSLALFSIQTNQLICPQLRQLAGIIKNPSTPKTYGKTRALRPDGTSAKRNITTQNVSGVNSMRPPPAGSVQPTTPHAIRAIQRRAAALTPGRDRRRSARLQRETPRDVLRNLSKGERASFTNYKGSPLNLAFSSGDHFAADPLISARVGEE